MVQDNVLYTFVGGAFKFDHSGDPVAAEGDVAIELEGGAYADDGSHSIGDKNFRIIRMNKDGLLEKSPWFSGATGGIIGAGNDEYVGVTLPTGAYTPATPASDEETLYSVWIVIKDSETTFGNKSMMKNIVYKAAAGASVADVTAGLLASFEKVMAREPYKYLTAVDNGTDITFTGAEKPSPKPGLSKCEFYEFEILPGENGTATHTAGVQGSLLECQIKEDEWFAQGNRGYGYRVDSIPVESQLSSQGLYDTLTTGDLQKLTYLKGKLQQFTNVVGQSPASLAEVHVYLPMGDGTAQTGSEYFNMVLNTADAISGLKADY